MIAGKVSSNVEARITVEMIRRDGLTHPVEVVLDTGFSEDLVLPSDIIHQLELEPRGDIRMILADGRRTALPVWAGYVIWHERPRRVSVIESSSEALLGMNLLLGSKVTMDVRIDGDVTIEE